MKPIRQQISFPEEFIEVIDERRKKTYRTRPLEIQYLVELALKSLEIEEEDSQNSEK